MLRHDEIPIGVRSLTILENLKKLSPYETILFSNLCPCSTPMESLMDLIDAVFLDMILIEFGIELIKFLIPKFMELEKLYFKQAKWKKYSCLLIFMLILKRKEYSYMAAKTKIILIFVDRFLFYFGRMSVISITTNVTLWCEQEDKEHLAYIFTDN